MCSPRALSLVGMAVAAALALLPVPSRGIDLADRTLYNPAAYIPSQCYTDTIDAAEGVHNPCFTCHQPSQRPNYINDGDLQLSYDFAEPARENRWINLFRDRTEAVAGISDETIQAYVRTDNYFGSDGAITLARTLADPPPAWDADGDGRWGGYVPDCWFDFDAEGFDRRRDGTRTGWRAFAYYPFPGTFWPTNGSTDDVLIRLPAMFRADRTGTPDVTVYKVNLAIVEAVVRRRSVSLEQTVDERALGVDLDKDGRLGRSARVVYDWAPLAGRFMSYVGQAADALARGDVHLAGGLFPEGTEFLHTVRYIDVTEGGGIALAPRMKELRYMRKRVWQSYADLEMGVLGEMLEQEAFPDRLALFFGNVERGLSNGFGWMIQGFIEDAEGALRPQTFEETVFCLGCHGGIGAVTDSVFSFPRRLGPDAHQAGWYHWNQKGLDGLAEPQRSDGRFEYATYLRENGAGDEFRANTEVMDRFFADPQTGTLKPDAEAALRADISTLLYPSPARAQRLNKAYRVIVAEQSFIWGRDATIAPAETVHRRVDAQQPTGVTEIVAGP